MKVNFLEPIESKFRPEYFRPNVSGSPRIRSMLQVLDTDGGSEVLQSYHAIQTQPQPTTQCVQAGQAGQLAGTKPARKGIHFTFSRLMWRGLRRGGLTVGDTSTPAV